jgi:hypothetical protein
MEIHMLIEIATFTTVKKKNEKGVINNKATSLIIKVFNAYVFRRTELYNLNRYINFYHKRLLVLLTNYICIIIIISI